MLSMSIVVSAVIAAAYVHMQVCNPASIIDVIIVHISC